MSSQEMTMSSSRPYLIRAFHDWILDNNATPYIVVDAGQDGVQVPMDFVSNGQIVLNISPSAAHGLLLGDADLQFNARFGGVPMRVYVPVSAVMAIYAKENGQGMVFGSEPGLPPDPGSGPSSDSTPETPHKKADESKSGKPKLKVVK